MSALIMDRKGSIKCFNLLLLRTWLIGQRFYYADERRSNGMPAMMERSGELKAKFYTLLAEQKE